PRNHRTESVDYAIVMSGEIVMEIDGATVHLRAGDVMVQRGTIHNWTNPGTEPCIIAFVLVAAKPVERAGKLLGATGGRLTIIVALRSRCGLAHPGHEARGLKRNVPLLYESSCSRWFALSQARPRR